VCAYIDLNPVAAGIAAAAETSQHTSIRQRVRHVKGKGKLSELKAAESGSVAGSRALGNIEQDNWLCPLEDRRRLGCSREGMSEGFSLGSYLLLVDYTSRLCRQGKVSCGPPSGVDFGSARNRRRRMGSPDQDALRKDTIARQLLCHRPRPSEGSRTKTRRAPSRQYGGVPCLSSTVTIRLSR
jgi:hypothetical protein